MHFLVALGPKNLSTHPSSYARLLTTFSYDFTSKIVVDDRAMGRQKQAKGKPKGKAKAKPKAKPKTKAAPKAAAKAAAGKKNGIDDAPAGGKRASRSPPSPSKADNSGRSSKRPKKAATPHRIDFDEEVFPGDLQDERAGRFVEEEVLATGQKRVKDLSFAAGSGVAAQSKGIKNAKLKGKSLQGEPQHLLGMNDADLTAEQTAELQEKGVSGDLINLPWAVVRCGAVGGSEIKKNASGYNSYLITWAAPDPKKHPHLLQPKDVQVKAFLDTVWKVHEDQEVYLAKAVARREKENDHEHMHAAVTAGTTNWRYR